MDERTPSQLLNRLVTLNEATLALSTDLDLDAVLQRIVDLARALVGARYCALGIVGSDGFLSDFITAGLSTTEREQIGAPPRGHGILGVLIREQRPLRLRDMRDDPRSVGFPPHHPPMVSFLGVPIRVDGDAIGNLYLTEKEGADAFTIGDQQLVEQLAQHAAHAVVNARRYTETEMQRALLQAVVEYLPEAVEIREASEGRLLMANQLALDLLGVATLPAGGLAETTDTFRAERPTGVVYMPHDLPVARALREGERIIDEEIVVRQTDSEPIHLAVSAIPVRTPDGAVAAVVSLFRDITRAREAEQLKNDFLSLVSHELRTPLTTIQGATHMLLTQGDDLSPAAREALRLDLANESERLAQMLKNMLALASHEAGRLHIERDPFLIQPVLREVARTMRERGAAHTIVVNLPRHLPPVEGDEELIVQVVRNLVENAVKYAPAGGTITLSAEAMEHELIVQVHDEGPGIPLEEQQRIFRRFHRASTGRQGMGLGLYLCQRLVEAHGGRIGVESAPGRGTTFRFSLPLLREEGDAW